MLLLFRQGGGSSGSLSQSAGRAIERDGHIHYFDSDEELERFLAKQEAIPLAEAVEVVQEVKAVGFNALVSAPVIEEIVKPFLPTPLPHLTRSQRKTFNDDEEAIFLLLH